MTTWVAHPQHTKVADIEDLRGAVLSHTGEELSVRASRDSHNRCQMGTVYLDEFDSLILLLPELQKSVDGGSNEEVGRPVIPGSITRFAVETEYIRTHLVITAKLTTSRCMKLL